MFRLIIAATGLSLIAPALAQGVTTPQGGLTLEGTQYAYYLGRYADGRFQFVDGEHTGGKAFVITEIGYRLDNRSHTTSTAMGRSWSNVTLNMSETSKYDTLGATFASNITSTPQLVFNNKADWDSQIGAPLLKPDIWGGLRGKLRFPFTAPWTYTAKSDMLLDYSFTGGALLNGAPWSGSSAWSYYLDGENVSTSSMSGLSERPVTRANPPCNDASVTYTSIGNNAYVYANAYTYGANSSTITQRNKLLVSHYSYYTAPNAPVVHVLGIGSQTLGIDAAARCNKLHVNMNLPYFMIPMRTIKGNTSNYSGSMGYLVPWEAAMSRFQMHMQAAWVDSVTGAFSLTEPVNLRLPVSLPPSQLPRRKLAYGYTGATSNYVTSSLYAQPYTAYKTK